MIMNIRKTDIENVESCFSKQTISLSKKTKIYNNFNHENKKDGPLLIRTDKKVRWDIESKNKEDALLYIFEIIRIVLAQVEGMKPKKNDEFIANLRFSLFNSYNKFFKTKTEHCIYKIWMDQNGHHNQNVIHDLNAQKPHINYYLYLLNNNKYPYFNTNKLAGHVFWVKKK